LCFVLLALALAFRRRTAVISAPKRRNSRAIAGPPLRLTTGHGAPPSRPAKPTQTRAPRRRSARSARRPAGRRSSLRLRVGIPETGETGIVETREPLFLRRRRLLRVCRAVSPIPLKVPQSHQFRLGPGFAHGRRPARRKSDRAGPSSEISLRITAFPRRPTGAVSPKVRPLNEYKESADWARIRSMSANVIRVRSKACRSAG
jgi:hypothetical protein